MPYETALSAIFTGDFNFFTIYDDLSINEVPVPFRSLSDRIMRFKMQGRLVHLLPPFDYLKRSDRREPEVKINELRVIRRPEVSQGLVTQSDGFVRPYPPLEKTRFSTIDGSTPVVTWSLALDRANDVYNLAMGGLIIGSLITIIAVIALIWASGVRNHYADQNFAKVVALSDQAKAEAAKANERAAEFFVKAQQIALEQEKARLEIEQVRKLSAGRVVSADQAAKIAKALQGHSLSLNMLSPSDDSEASQFAEDIAKALTNAGVKVTASKSFLPLPIRGLAMSMSSSDSGTMIYMALRSAGFEMKDLPERDPVMIVVGSKAPPGP